MAEIIAFPLDRVVGRARHVAALYMARHTQIDRESYWRSVVRGLTRTYLRFGLKQQVIDAELTRFAAAVNTIILEIDARTRQSCEEREYLDAHAIHLMLKC